MFIGGYPADIAQKHFILSKGSKLVRGGHVDISGTLHGLEWG